MTDNYEEVLKQIKSRNSSPNILIQFLKEHPHTVTESNVDSILRMLESKKIADNIEGKNRICTEDEML